MSSSSHSAGSQALPISQLPKSSRKDWRSKLSPNVSEEQAQDHLMTWYIHKSMWPAEIHPKVLRQLVDVAGNPLSITFKKSWQLGEIPENWKKGKSTSIISKSGKKYSQNHTES